MRCSTSWRSVGSRSGCVIGFCRGSVSGSASNFASGCGFVSYSDSWHSWHLGSFVCSCSCSCSSCSSLLPGSGFSSCFYFSSGSSPASYFGSFLDSGISCCDFCSASGSERSGSCCDSCYSFCFGYSSPCVQFSSGHQAFWPPSQLSSGSLEQSDEGWSSSASLAACASVTWPQTSRISQTWPQTFQTSQTSQTCAHCRCRLAPCQLSAASLRRLHRSAQPHVRARCASREFPVLKTRLRRASLLPSAPCPPSSAPCWYPSWPWT
mmetsp:Transcript_39687/g.86632  ORF Transcript_39687/g.86632 Transcript_39687/m.86632 type:complete len:265 (-) Transcript_39687:815-1609(-)